MKVIFMFAGTGDDGVYYSKSKENQVRFEDDVVRIYIQGCQHPNVGGGGAFPDLNIAANNVRNAFDSEGNLDFGKLKANFGAGISSIEPYLAENMGKMAVEQIGLCGFSRGAVTTFAAAKKLNDLDIPIDIVANQPVPGDIISSSIYKSFSDLSDCHNIRSATTYIGSYTNEVNFIHDHFFYQMLAGFPESTEVSNRLFPYHSHLEWFRFAQLNARMGLDLMRHGYARDNNYQQEIEHFYKGHHNWIFTPHEYSQFVYGNDGTIEIDEYYYLFQKNQAISWLTSHDCCSADEAADITGNQALAINVLFQLQIEDDKRNEYIKLALQDNANGNKFCDIVIKVHDACRYFDLQTRDDESNKNQFVLDNSEAFKTKTIDATYQYLSLEKPKLFDKKNFTKKLHQAGNEFCKKALNIDRGYARITAMLVINFITHVTGTFLIFNTVNKVRTGNWLLFSETASKKRLNTLNSSIDRSVKEPDQKPSTDGSPDAKEQGINEAEPKEHGKIGPNKSPGLA